MKRQIGEKTQRIKAERREKKIQKDKTTEERRKDKKA